METFGIITLALLIFVNIWATIRAEKARKEYELAAEAERQGKKTHDDLRSYLEGAVRDWHSQVKRVYATYRFSESDFNKHPNSHTAMEKEAKTRLACALGRRIVKNLGVDEVIEEGMLTGYHVEVEVRRKFQN